MSVNALHAISPVDGRYQPHTEVLSQYFSEASLIRYRVLVEVAYLKALCEQPLPQLIDVSQDELNQLWTIYTDFSDSDAGRVKAIEATTNHDVKAVEYFIREKIEGTPLERISEFVHFGLTSQDVNNTAMPVMLKQAIENVMLPVLREVLAKLDALADTWGQIPLLAHTHGQPASPTFLGKELAVFAERLRPMIQELETFRHTGKFGGATGNFNAHHIAYPDINWVVFSNRFLKEYLSLDRQQVTTQIEHFDGLAALFHLMIRINTVLLDLDRDMWSYISMNVFTQKTKAGEVGSSAMPHKVNPIDFENSEGNIGVANALFGFMAEKLPVSRLQRDLTDSTVTRNIGVPLAHTLIAWKSLLKGLNKIVVNQPRIEQILDENWAVLAEAIQTVLRREGVPNPYEKLKGLTRGNARVTAATLSEFIDSLDVSIEVRNALKNLTPATYTGYDHTSLMQR